MNHHVTDYFRGLLAVLVGGSVSIAELLRSGSLVLTFLGALVAFLGGIWTIRTSRERSAIATLERRIKEIELRRLENESQNPFRPAA